MLTVTANGAIQFTISHLLEDVPTDLDGVIQRYKVLDPTLFHHVVSSPDCGYERKCGVGRVPPEFLVMDAEHRMKNILTGGRIFGNPKGFFVNKPHPSLTASQIEEIKSVSFTLCSSSDLPKHFDARGSDYGICFFHDFLETAGIRPVVYLNNQPDHLKQQMVFNSPHLVEFHGKAYDKRWEKEWRIKERLEFTRDDVAFLFAPDAAYKSFVKWLYDEDLDYTVLPSSIIRDPLAYLRMLPNLEHRSWGQIEILGGLLMDFDQFFPYTAADRVQMEVDAGEIARCLAKADLQDSYEHRFVRRYLEFVRQLSGHAISTDVMADLTKVEKNSREPWRSSIDLAKAAYGRLFEIQKARITMNWFPGD